jgi:hypothetical protein
LSNVPELPEHTTKFIASLSKDDIGRLNWLLQVIEMVDGWCKINRVIGKFLIASIIGALILFSQGFDALRNLLSWGGKH